MYFDMHIHFFPDNLVERAIPKLATICEITPATDGTRADTVQKLKNWGCLGGMALHIATSPQQQSAVNSFARASQYSMVKCFGSVHPDAPNISEEIRRIKNTGLYGIKLHPDYQEFFVDDKRAFPIYERAAKVGLPITFHAGQDPLSPTLVHATPKALAHVADLFPNLTIIAAHMGGAYLPKESARYLAKKPNVFFDTATATEFLTSADFEELVYLFGADRIFFATDCPWSTVPREVALIEKTNLSEKEKEQIFYRNALDFFNLKPHDLK